MASKLILCLTVMCLFSMASSAYYVPAGGNTLLQILSQLLRQPITTTARAATQNSPVQSTTALDSLLNLINQILARLQAIENQVNSQPIVATATAS